MKIEQAVYSQINERLNAITNALNVHGEDQVISICSAGAQPLALLENLGEKGRVLAIDNNQDQLRFARDVAETIRNKDSATLVRMNIAPRDRNYFSNAKRIDSIRKNLSKLDFKPMDVSMPIAIRDEFTKGYFSNADVNLRRVYQLFRKDSLIYVTFSSILLPKNIDQFLSVYSDRNNFDFGKFYEVDNNRSLEACRSETVNTGDISLKGITWTPLVLRRK